MTETESADVMIQKHDALLHQFQTLKLEKEVYEKEIIKLRQEIVQLKEDKEVDKELLQTCDPVSPALTNLNVALNIALHASDLQKEKSFVENQEHKELIQQLQQENNALTLRCEQYHKMIETVQRNQT
eukprot:330841_1